MTVVRANINSITVGIPIFGENVCARKAHNTASILFIIHFRTSRVSEI